MVNTALPRRPAF